MAQNIFRYVDVALQATYDALATKDANTMYGVRETGRIYFGSTLMADNDVVVTSAIPSTAGQEDKLYMVTSGEDIGIYHYDTTEGKYVSVSSFKNMKTTTIRDASSATDTVLPTEKAVRTELDTKVDKVTGYSLVDDDEIAKLATVEENANNYIHPDIAAAVTAGTSYNKVSFDAYGHVATASAETTLAGLGLDGDAYTKTQIDTMIAEVTTDLSWKPAVATFADIATTYPNPEDGWTVSTKDTNNVYRYDETDDEWVNIFSAESNLVIPTSETGARNGLMSSAQAEKLKNIETGAEVNQNAYSTIKIGQDTVSASGKTDTLELIGGTNITISDSSDAQGHKITITGPASYVHPDIASGVTPGTSYNKVSFDSLGHVATASAETTMNGLGITGRSSDITSMSNYAIALSASAIATTDTLNQAIGKLEYRIKNGIEDQLTQTIDSNSTSTQIASAAAIYAALEVQHI